MSFWLCTARRARTEASPCRCHRDWNTSPPGTTITHTQSQSHTQSHRHTIAHNRTQSHTQSHNHTHTQSHTIAHTHTHTHNHTHTITHAHLPRGVEPCAFQPRLQAGPVALAPLRPASPRSYGSPCRQLSGKSPRALPTASFQKFNLEELAQPVGDMNVQRAC